MTTVQQLQEALKTMPPNATVMLGGMVIGGDPIQVELDSSGRDTEGQTIVWLT